MKGKDEGWGMKGKERDGERKMRMRDLWMENDETGNEKSWTANKTYPNIVYPPQHVSAQNVS